MNIFYKAKMTHCSSSQLLAPSRWRCHPPRRYPQFPGRWPHSRCRRSRLNPPSTCCLGYPWSWTGWFLCHLCRSAGIREQEYYVLFIKQKLLISCQCKHVSWTSWFNIRFKLVNSWHNGNTCTKLCTCAITTINNFHPFETVYLENLHIHMLHTMY